MTGRRTCSECGLRENASPHALGEHEYVDATKGGIAAVSRGRRAYLKKRQPIAWQGQRCAIEIPLVCTGMAQGEHHVMPRGIAGGLEAADEYPRVVSCNACNSAVQSTVGGRAWAEEHGLLLSYPALTERKDAEDA